MKSILLSDLMRAPAWWHEMIPLGTLRGGELVLEDELAAKLPAEIPVADWPYQPPIPTPQPQPPAQSHKLPDSVRDERLAICATCDQNQNGLCVKCQTCAGRKVDWKVQAVFEFCPLTPPKWGRYLSP